jgi:deoxyadenosine/deoxycytidine kinase
MTDLEWKMYNQWYECLVKETFEDINMPDGYIYIRADPETSYQRMLKRERSEEKCVPKEYLETINRYHDEWLKTIEPEKVLIIDVDKDFEHTPEEWERILGIIQDFIQ